jgi:hypothetical protein
MGIARLIGDGIEAITEQTMDGHPAIQAAAGFALLFLTPLLAGQLPGGPRGIGTYLGAAGALGGLVLTIVAIARVLLRWMDAESYSDASTTQQLIVLAVGTLTVVGLPLVAFIAVAALS